MSNHRSLYSSFITPPISVGASQNCLVYHSAAHPAVDSRLLPLAPPSSAPPLFLSPVAPVAWERHPLRPWPDLRHTPRCGGSGQSEPHHHGLLPRGRGQSRAGPPGPPLGPRGSRWVPRLPRWAGRDAPGACGLTLPSSHPLQVSSRTSWCHSRPWWWGTRAELSLCPARSVGLWNTSTGSASWRARRPRGFSI